MVIEPDASTSAYDIDLDPGNALKRFVQLPTDAYFSFFPKLLCIFGVFLAIAP